jgi:hypothetical protein
MTVWPLSSRVNPAFAATRSSHTLDSRTVCTGGGVDIAPVLHVSHATFMISPINESRRLVAPRLGARWNHFHSPLRSSSHSIGLFRIAGVWFAGIRPVPLASLHLVAKRMHLDVYRVTRCEPRREYVAVIF